MAFFENLGNKMQETGERLADQARNQSYANQIERDIKMMIEKKEQDFCEIGKRVYQAKKDNQVEEPDLSVLIKEIDLIEEDLKNATRQRDNYMGVVRCKNCGTVLPSSQPFCSQCGSSLNNQ